MGNISGTVIVSNLIPQLQSLWPFIKIMGLFVGFILFIAGLHSVISKGRNQGHLKGPIYAMLGGIILLNLMGALDAMANSIFAQSSVTGLTYSAGGSDPTSLYIQFAIYVVQLVGICGFIQGCILIKKSGEEGQHVGRAITHLIGGTLGVNIVATINVLASSTGISLQGFFGN